MRARVLAMLLLLAVVGSSSAQHVPEDVRFYLGYANWECDLEHPYAYARLIHNDTLLVSFTSDSQLIYTPLFVEIVAHELTHLQQMKHFGSCEAWKNAITDDEYGYQLEMEAYRAGETFKNAQRAH